MIPRALSFSLVALLASATLCCASESGKVVKVVDGDTIRVSLTEAREKEIPVCYSILQALGLRKLVASAAPQFRDWLALAVDARCARSWEDAVNAAYLAAKSAEDPRRRQQALLRLAQALEGHWRYGAGEALAAYRAAAQLGPVPRPAAQHPQFADRRGQLPRNQIEESRLARTVRSQQPDDLPAVDVQTDPVDHGPSAVVLGGLFRLDQLRVACHCPVYLPADPSRPSPASGSTFNRSETPSDRRPGPINR